MHNLTEKYRPSSIASFVGLDAPKRIARKLADKPFASSWLFVGEPGIGKTTLALAIANEMFAELHHVPSQDCTLDTLKRIVSTCHHMPMMGKTFHLILIDEANDMSAAAQLYLYSKMDESARIPNTIIICTANSTDRLTPAFLSRCVNVDFSSYGNAAPTTQLLAKVWDDEAPADAVKPNFARIVKEATGNVRASLMRLQKELLLA